jgi:DNA-binding response OmpR family regulator
VQVFFSKAKWTDTMLNKILVVDDEESVRDLLQSFLTATGYQTILASNGEEAIEIAKSESPNAILLDVKMPGINGIETCRILRAQEETKLIPVIMATALGITKPEATDAGADDIIYKPFNLADLALRVKSILCIGDLRDRAQRLMTYMEQLDKNCPE